MIELKYIDKRDSESRFNKISVKVDDQPACEIPIIGLSDGFRDRDEALLEVLEKVINATN